MGRTAFIPRPATLMGEHVSQRAILDAAIGRASLAAVQGMLDAKIEGKPRWIRPLGRMVRNSLLSHYMLCSARAECSTCCRLLAQTSGWQEQDALHALDSLQDVQEKGAMPRTTEDPAVQTSDLAACEEDHCVICLTHQKTIAFVPCGHLCVCDQCAQSGKLLRDRCPVCRQQANTLLRIFK